MTKLEQSIQELFPIEYSVHTWRNLIPRYLAVQDELYADEVSIFTEVTSALGIDAQQQTPATGYPVLPVEYGEACEELNKMEGHSYLHLSIALNGLKNYNQRLEQRNEYLERRNEWLEQRNKYLEQRNKALEKEKDTYKQLCGEYDEASMNMAEAYRLMEQQRDDMYRENQALKDFNNRSIN